MAVVLDRHAFDGIHLGASERHAYGIRLSIDRIPDELDDGADGIPFACQARNEVTAGKKWKVPHQTHRRARVHPGPIGSGRKRRLVAPHAGGPAVACTAPSTVAQIEGLDIRAGCVER